MLKINHTKAGRLSKYLIVYSAVLFSMSAFSQGPPPPQPQIKCFTGVNFSDFAYAGDSERFDLVPGSSFQEMKLSDDGTKMYILETINNSIQQYSLRFPFDVSSATLDSGSQLSVNNEETSPTSFTLTEDGLKLYVIGTDSKRVHSYSLSSANEISSATYDSLSASFLVENEDMNPQGLALNDLGDQLLVLGGENQKVIQYTLSSSFDVSSAVFSHDFSLPSGSNATSIDYNRIGSDIYVLDKDISRISKYGIGIPINVSNAQSRGEVDLSATETDAKGFDYAYPWITVLGVNNNAVLEFNFGLSSNYTESTANDGSISTNSNPTTYFMVDAAGNSFKDEDNDGILDGGVTFTNLPTGLTPVFTLSPDKQQATLQFTGTASEHANIDDVLDVGIAFTSDSHDIVPAPPFNCPAPVVIDFNEESASVNDYLLNQIKLFVDDHKNLNIQLLGDLIPQKLSLHNLMGQEVLNIDAFDPNVTDYQFPIMMETGMYIIMLKTDSGKISKKIIIH